VFWLLAGTEKIANIRHKVPEMEGLQKASCNFSIFFSDPGPRKNVKTPPEWRILGKVWRQGRGYKLPPTPMASWRSSSAPPDYLTLDFIAGWAWKLLNEDLPQKHIPYAFLNIFMESWNWNFVGNRRFFSWSKWGRFVPGKLLRRFFPRELLPISPFHFV